jgi:hypothetical protein
MKKNLSLVSFIILLLIVLSCTKEEQKELVETVLPEKFSATINDTAWNAITRKTTQQAGQFLLIGTSTTGKVLQLSIFGSTAKTYSLNTSILDTNSASVQFAAVYKKSATQTLDAYYAKHGNIVVSEVNTTDQTISGTFEFTMFRASSNVFITTDSVVVTSGSFSDLKY